MSDNPEYPNPSQEDINNVLEDLELKNLYETENINLQRRDTTNKAVKLIRDLKFSQNLKADAQEILDFAQIKLNANTFIDQDGEVDLLKWVKFIEKNYKVVVKPDKDDGDWSEYVIANEIRKKLIELYKYHKTRRGIL